MLDEITRGRITGLLASWDHGDPAALDRLLSLIFADLQRLARFHLAKRRPDHTLPPSGLVNEMYIKLTAGNQIPAFRDRGHFFSFASRLMRMILIDYERARNAGKRHGAYQRVPVDEVERTVGSPGGFELLELRHALDQLGEVAPRQREIVELRYFLGLSLDEIAQALEISPSTVSREWSAARAWLYSQLRTEPMGQG